MIWFNLTVFAFLGSLFFNFLPLNCFLVLLVYLFLIYLYIFQCANLNFFSLDLVEMRRVELLTSCLQGRRSSQLSYTPFPFRGRVPESFPLRVGSDLSSRTVSSQVFSALQSLTTVFGMGTGGPSALLEPTSRYLSVPSVRNNRSRIELFASAFRLRLSP